MSLQVWLPLTQNTDNQGLYPIEKTVNIKNSFSNNGGKLGRTVQFTSGDYIKISDPIKSTTKEFTIAFWVKFSTVSGTQTLWAGRSTTGKSVAIHAISNKIRFDSSSQVTSGTTFVANTWYHILCILDSNKNQKIYVNGVQNNISTNQSVTTDKVNVYGTIGMSSAADVLQTNPFTGWIQDFRIYDNALSIKEIKELAKGLYVHYKFDKDEKSSITSKNNRFRDYSGMNNHCENFSRTVIHPEDSPRYGLSTKVNANEFIEKYNLPDTLYDFTISVWIKCEITYNRKELVICGVGECSIYLTGGYLQNGNYFYDLTPYSNTWTNIVIVVNKNNGEHLYINGEYIPPESPVSYSIMSGDLMIGDDNTPLYISDLRLYATELSAADVKALYNNPISIDNCNNLHSLEFIESDHENLLDNLNTQYATKGSMSNSFNTSQPNFVPYNQTNCKCQYGGKPGFNFIRVANINDYASGGRTTYGGPRIDFNNKPLVKNHSYIIMFDYEGHFDTSSFGYTRWSYNDGWEGDNSLMPSPTQILKTGIVDAANTETKKRFIYAFTINDDIKKVCKTSFSSYVAGNSYLSYRYFAWHYGYATSGTGQGTDAYLTNFKMYDITNYVNSGFFTKEGLVKMFDFDDFLSESKIHKYGLISMNNFIED